MRTIATPVDPEAHEGGSCRDGDAPSQNPHCEVRVCEAHALDGDGAGRQVPDLQNEGSAALCEVVGRLHDEERPKNLLRSDGQGDVLPSLRGFGSPERLVEVP